MKTICPHCNFEYPEIDDSLLDKKVECAECGEIFVAKVPVFDRQIDIKQSSTKKHKQYKVLSIKDGGWLARFDAKQMEIGLNELAQHGWHVITITTADVIGFAGKREEMIIIMERDIVAK